MADFWVDRGLADPDAVKVDLPPATETTMPADDEARRLALELAVACTMSAFDGGKDRMMDRAREFHSFLVGR